MTMTDSSSDRLVDTNRSSNGVALLRLTNGRTNALSSRVLEELSSAIAELKADPPGAVVIWGGSKIFSAGADVKELNSGTAKRISGAFHETLNALAAFERPTFAAINGYALGGGLELALACDFRIGGRLSKFGLPEIQLGILPGGGGTQRLPKLIGHGRAKEMIFTGRHIGSGEAHDIGLVNEVVPDDQVCTEALSRAARLAAGPLLAIAKAKELIDKADDQWLSAGLEREMEAFISVFDSADAQIGIESFLSHGTGKARFTGR